MKKNKIGLIPIPVLYIFVTGFLVRFYYILNTTTVMRQHDVYGFDINGGGHGRYIMHFLQNWSLPDFDPTTVWQMGHPPLHHFLCAVWLKIQTDVFGVSFEDATESLQYLTLLYSMLIAYIAFRIFVRLGLNGIALYAATGVVTLHPAFILLSGSINNDCLSTLFMIGAIYFAIRWYQEEKTRFLLLCALFIGLGMMTKLTVVVVAVPVGVMMLWVLIRKIREKGWKKLIIPYISFGVIGIPLGIWFPLYNHIRWGTDFLFVHPMDPACDQYLGDRSFLSRCFDFSPMQFNSIYEHWLSYDGNGNPVDFNDFNPVTVALKTACFGEYTNNDTFHEAPVINSLAGIVFFSSIIIAGVGLFAMIWTCIQKKSTTDIVLTVFMLAFYGIMMIGFYRNAAAYPYVCTMNFRYITPTVVVGALFFGMMLKRLWEMIHGRATVSERKQKIAAYSYYGLVLCSVAFCISSSIVMIGLAKFQV